MWLGLPNSENDVKPEDYETALKGMNEILFCGLSELSDEDRLQVVLHVMDKKHWAKLVKPKKKHISALVPGAMQSTSSSSAKSRKRTADELYAGASEALVRTAQGREKFMLPIPGKDGCVPGSLNGKTIVLSGIFPEVGGGAGLSLGKDKVVSMAQSFGGKVTGGF